MGQLHCVPRQLFRPWPSSLPLKWLMGIVATAHFLRKVITSLWPLPRVCVTPLAIRIAFHVARRRKNQRLPPLQHQTPVHEKSRCRQHRQRPRLASLIHHKKEQTQTKPIGLNPVSTVTKANRYIATECPWSNPCSPISPATNGLIALAYVAKPKFRDNGSCIV